MKLTVVLFFSSSLFLCLCTQNPAFPFIGEEQKRVHSALSQSKAVNLSCDLKQSNRLVLNHFQSASFSSQRCRSALARVCCCDTTVHRLTAYTCYMWTLFSAGQGSPKCRQLCVFKILIANTITPLKNAMSSTLCPAGTQ